MIAKVTPKIEYAHRCAHNGNIKKAKSGLAFDGILDSCIVGTQCRGHLFYSDQCEHGEYYRTAEIVKVGETQSNGKYVETIEGRRYLVFPDTPSGFDVTREFIKINYERYFKDLQWS